MIGKCPEVFSLYLKGDGRSLLGGSLPFGGEGGRGWFVTFGRSLLSGFYGIHPASICKGIKI